MMVCRGNVCRSPMAEALLRQALPDRIVSSTGIEASDGAPADGLAMDVCAAAGIDIVAHRARQLTLARLDAADLVLVMTRAQRTMVQMMYPQVSGRVFQLGDRSGLDVADPVGGARPMFERVFKQLHSDIRDWVPRILAC